MSRPCLIVNTEDLEITTVVEGRGLEWSASVCDCNHCNKEITILIASQMNLILTLTWKMMV